MLVCDVQVNIIFKCVNDKTAMKNITQLMNNLSFGTFTKLLNESICCQIEFTWYVRSMHHN